MGNEISLRDKYVLDKFAAAAVEVIHDMRKYEERGETVVGIELRCNVQCQSVSEVEGDD